MLATLIEKPFDDPNWIFEIKWDGYRAIAEINNGSVELYSRNLLSFNTSFKPIVDELKKIDLSIIFDGEIVILDDQGKPSFQLLQNYKKNGKGYLVYYIFDLLYLNGYDLRKLPLEKRKEILNQVIPNSKHLRYCEHIEQKGTKAFNLVVKEGYEGIVAKEFSSIYEEKRSKKWLKIKSHLRQEVIICGFTEPRGSRSSFGALILGVYDQEKKLKYVGHAGGGFDEQTLGDLYKKLIRLKQLKSPLTPLPKTNTPVTWVKPKLICEVSFAEWTEGGQMRQPIFMGLRKDKKPEEVLRENPKSIKSIVKKSDSTKSMTNLSKVFWPKEGYTKGDLIEYYKEVSPYILPYLKGRPETLHRYPNGITGPSFYQKNVENVPDFVQTEKIEHEDHSVNYIIINTETSLLYVINLGCIELHPFGARIDTLEYPNYVILDLDPEDISFEKVIETAQVVHEILEELDIPSVCKTSGKRGLHIYIPLEGQYTYEEVAYFAKLIAVLVHQKIPGFTSLERRPKNRQKKVYIDYTRNGFGQTVVAPYSVRPVSGATISTPLKWSEVVSGLDPQNFTIKTVLKRFEKEGDLFKLVLKKGINIKKILKKLDKIQG